MPYNPGGLFSLVASYFATPGTSIRTEQHNPVFEDVAAALSSVVLKDGRAPMTGPLNMNGFAINNVATGNTPSSVATLAQGFPIGGVIDYAGSSPPAGWALCFGQPLNRLVNSALFAAIGTSYGAGDGSTTFNVPDLRGRVSAGFDAMGGASANRLPEALAAGVGARTHTLTPGQIPLHSHSGTTSGMNANNPHSHDYGTVVGGGGSFPGGGSFQLGTATTQGRDINHGHDFVTNNGNGLNGEAHNNVQPTLIMNKIIRVSYDV